MADHPRPRGRKTLGAAAGSLDKAGRLGRATATAWPMRRLVFANGLRRIGAALVGGVGLALIRGHAKEIRCGQDHTRRFAFASWTILRRIAFRHRPHIHERTAIVTEIFVNRHFVSSNWSMHRRDECGAASTHCPARRHDYLSCESDTSTPPLMCFTGPADDGMISKSKISVGKYSVAQAFGMSTTPLICPCTGATPKIV